MLATTYRILIVDDILDNVLLLQTILEEEGYDIDIADNGSLALAKVESNPPDLVLMDVMMPGMNGYEVTQQIRQMPKVSNIPILLVTAYDNTELPKCMSSGANACLRKPIDINELLERVSASLPIKGSVPTKS